MDARRSEKRAYEAQRVQANKAELGACIARMIRDDGVVEPFNGVYLARASAPMGPLYSVSVPSLCVIAQGHKEILLGEGCYQYDPAHYLLTTVDLPIISHIRDASQAQPYLSIRVHLDPTSRSPSIRPTYAQHPCAP